MPELVAVVAQRQGLGEVVRQRLEAGEVIQPGLLGQVREPDLGGRPVVAKAQPMLGKLRGPDRVVEALPQLEPARVRLVEGYSSPSS